MDKIKVLVLGLGNFGHSWAADVLPACQECADLVGVVEKQKDKWQGIAEQVPKYENLVEALEKTKPDLVINVTPPNLHSEICTFLLKKHIAVLCEKPIADTYENALRMGQILKETQGFLMIGENYRYHAVFREAGKILKTEHLGSIHHIQCMFRHYHPDYSMFYHGALEHPLLEDVTIHHLDLARFLTGKEPVRVWCREFPADYSWYAKRPASADIVTEMTDHVIFHYNGTLASPVSSTDWNGNWEVECENGVMRIETGKIYVLLDGEKKEVYSEKKEEDSRIAMLREACEALRENRKAETDYLDNFKSFNWMQKAIQASKQQEWIVVNE